MIDLLPSLLAHTRKQAEFQSVSILAPIIGLYQLQMKGFDKVNFIVMKNQGKVADPEGEITMKFDLKGSMINRRAFNLSYYSKFSRREVLKSSDILKDLDIVFLQKQKEGIINLSPHQRLRLGKQIIRDTEFLAKHNLMDYSLLLLVEETTNFNTFTTEYKEEEKSFKSDILPRDKFSL